ncbi:MAG TPA: tRNA (adenosine(37)-N6)-threonylcarbamoyltransferase complex dimerization subunit type 1 TsaB [Candidatus Saccharimonadales bacterium]
MLIITIRTDKPEAELGIYKDQEQLAYHTWLAHRQLAETLHATLHAMLQTENKGFEDIQGIVVFKGPGSFTGLRIGASITNALSDSLQVPIIGATDPEWLETGIKQLLDGEDQKLILPEYGAPVHITQQRK